jgi:hypothetical protein
MAFNNGSATLISTNAVQGGAALGSTAGYPGSGEPQFVYALFAAPSSVTSVSGVTDPSWAFTGFYATNTTGVGRLVGGLLTLPAPYAPGTTYSFLVRGWSSSIAGEDWATVQTFVHPFEVDPNASGNDGQLFGTSNVATMTVGGGLLPTEVIFGVVPGTIQGFLLDQVPIPEPSVFAMVGLGIAALLAFRRSFRDREAD